MQIGSERIFFESNVNGAGKIDGSSCELFALKNFACTVNVANHDRVCKTEMNAGN